MSVDKKIKYEKDKPAVQGGVENYLGRQPEVQAPRKWKSSPDKPETELAYITKAEKDLILKANIHGGLEDGPNMGPSGIMSLDSFGDIGGGGQSGGDFDADPGGKGSFSGKGPGETDREFDKRKANQRATLQIAERRQADRLGYRERQNIANFKSKPKSKFGMNLIGGLMSLINPALGLFVRGVNFFGDKLQGLRGYNPDGTPRTQAEYEAAMRDKQIQGRIDNIMDRQRLGKTFSQKNLDSLLGMTDMYGDKFSPSTAQNVLTGRDLKGFTESRMGIVSPEVIEKFANPIGPQSINMPNANVETLDVGYQDPAFENALMVGLTEKQKQLLDQRKGMLDALGDQGILDTIKSEDDPNDPATIQDVRSYYGLA